MTAYEARLFRTLVGRRLRERRQELGLTQEEVALEAGVAQGSISHYEHGKHDLPLGVLIALCRALDVAPVQVVPGFDELSAPKRELLMQAS